MGMDIDDEWVGEPGTIRRFSPLGIAVPTSQEAGAVTVIEGYVVRYDTDFDMGDVVERVAPGAFSKTLESGADVICTFNHNVNQLLGRRASGTATFEDRPEGLWMSCKLPNTTIGRDVAEMVLRGDLTGQSFYGRNPVYRKQLRPGQKPVMLLTRVDLVEAGVVSRPAYKSSSVIARYDGAIVEKTYGMGTRYTFYDLLLKSFGA